VGNCIPTSPYDRTAAGAFGNASTLSSVHNYAVNLTTSFNYDASNTDELTQAIYPYGGYLRWQYGNAAYADTTIREVQQRFLQWDSSIGERTLTLTGTPGSSPSTPVSRSVIDSHANAFKSWQFLQAAGGTLGLVGTLSEGTASSQAVLRSTLYNWTQDPAGNNYIGRLQIVSVLAFPSWRIS
jgi:hypothetical protein